MIEFSEAPEGTPIFINLKAIASISNDRHEKGTSLIRFVGTRDGVRVKGDVAAVMSEITRQQLAAVGMKWDATNGKYYNWFPQSDPGPKSSTGSEDGSSSSSS